MMQFLDFAMSRVRTRRQCWYQESRKGIKSQRSKARIQTMKELMTMRQWYTRQRLYDTTEP
ncbi:hypothetical protein BDV19DRAFT_367043 [Aspergillus venezuelensis]